MNLYPKKRKSERGLSLLQVGFPSHRHRRTRFDGFFIIIVGILLVLSCHVSMSPAVAGPVVGAGFAAGSLLYDGNFEQTTGFPCEPGTPVTFTALLQVEFIRPLPLRLSVRHSSDEVSTIFQGESAGVDFKDTEFGLLAMYRFYDPPLSPVSLHLGGGFGFRLLTTRPVGSGNPDGFDESMVENVILWGLKGAGGLEVEIPALRCSIFMEGYFNFVYTSGDPVKFPEYSAGLLYRF